MADKQIPNCQFHDQNSFDPKHDHPVLWHQTPESMISSAVLAVIPAPPAAFSPFTITKSIRLSCRIFLNLS